MALVILTGASGSGKTTIAKSIAENYPAITVFRFDSVGVPSSEELASYGNGHMPGGTWMRDTTFKWMERIATVLSEGKHVLFEGQMRIRFILEALAAAKIHGAHILCIECDDATRMRRLKLDRLQPELADENMLGWSRYLHQGALKAGIEILDTSNLSLAESVMHVVAMFERRGGDGARFNEIS